MDDNETTVQQLLERIGRSIQFMESVDPMALTERNRDRSDFPSQRAWEAVSGCLKEDFLRSFVLPNAYFHVSTAFAILRNNGVPIGKFDYLLGEEAP